VVEHGPELSYAAVGVTRPAADSWKPGRREFQRTVAVGTGEACWNRCRTEVISWGVKTRSGFQIQPSDGASLEAVEGRDYLLRFSLGLVGVTEPVRVIAVINEPNRSGFAYGTLPGHPVAGEEAFIVDRDQTDTIWLTIRSHTRPAPGWRALAFPIFLASQRLLRRRYLRSLVC
jgi:uncharacterized protein (UPF0548 family)